LLIAGIDKVDDSTDSLRNQYRNGGQADFLMLLAIDHTDKVIHQLQIDRDTMTEVAVLGTFGNETGTRILQICLSHGFGKTPEDNAKYTMRAVQNLLDGLELDGYYMIPYSAVPVINDALGGVTVNIAFDMTSVHPEWKQGTTVTLHGGEAEDFVRSRMTVGAGTNEERMVRQNEFMQKAVARMNSRIKDDLGFGESLLKQLQSLSESNFSQKRLTEEMGKAYDYEVLPVDHPEGTYAVGADGFMEFHMREGAATEWVLQHLYTKVE
jgi:LCP family protein required for cell wall assembly